MTTMQAGSAVVMSPAERERVERVDLLVSLGDARIPEAHRHARGSELDRAT